MELFLNRYKYVNMKTVAFLTLVLCGGGWSVTFWLVYQWGKDLLTNWIQGQVGFKVEDGVMKKVFVTLLWLNLVANHWTVIYMDSFDLFQDMWEMTY
jgi:hypothetical protein